MRFYLFLYPVLNDALCLIFGASARYLIQFDNSLLAICSQYWHLLFIAIKTTTY